MKRFVILTVALLLCVSLLGCGGTEPTATTAAKELPALSVGYGRRDISPWEGIPLGGYSNSSERLCDGVVTERLFTTCIAFTDSTGNTVLLFHNDLVSTQPKVIDPIREMISQETGVPVDHILVAATHTHSAPDVNNLLAKKYVEELKQNMIASAKEALEDRKEATIQVAKEYPQKLNWIRYYNYSDGTWGSGTLPAGATRVSHIREETDNQLQMIRFVRADAKDVMLVNWQGHPHREGDDEALNASSDIVGAMRRILEEKDSDVLFAYFSGASGNLNNHSMIPGVTTTANQSEHGAALMEYMTKAEFKPVDTAPIQLIYRTEALTSKADKTNELDFPVCAFSIGDVAFVTAGYEMFDTSGQAIKESSKFDTTFVITYALAHNGYLPTEDAFESNNCYEVRITKVVKGSAEHMVGVYSGLLDEIWTMGNP